MKDLLSLPVRFLSVQFLPGGFSVVFLLFLSSFSFSARQKPVRLGVLDTAIDFSHPELATNIDTNSMKKLLFRRGDGSQLNWYELNQQCFKENRQRLQAFNQSFSQTGSTKELYQIAWQILKNPAAADKLLPQCPSQQIDQSHPGWRNPYLRMRGELPGSQLSPKQIEYYKKIRVIDSAISAIKTYVHGTYVTSVALEKYSNKGGQGRNLKIINFPYLCEYRRAIHHIFKSDKILRNNFKAEQEFTLKRYQDVMDGLHRQILEGFKSFRPHVINASLGFTQRDIEYFVDQKVDGEVKKYSPKRYRNFTQTILNYQLDKLRSFSIANRDSVVVFSTGNDKMNLDKNPSSFYRDQPANQVFVSALDLSMRQLTEKSDFGFQTVQIAAIGESVSGGVPFVPGIEGLQSLELSGTSVAAPVVSGTLLDFIQNGYGLSGYETSETLKNLFLGSSTTEVSELKSKIISGRILY